MGDVTGPHVEVDRVVAGHGRGTARADVLREISLSVDPGTVTAIVGPNGAGKSTLLRTLLGFLRPRSGWIRLDGLPPGRFRRRGGMGFLPEAPVLPAGWTVSEWLEAAARLRGSPSPLARREATDVLTALGLAGRASVRLERLSRGGARLAGLGFALAGGPPAVLLDEPLAALDVQARAAVRAIVRDLAERGATVLVATHELREVPGLADRALLLSEGRILAHLESPDPSAMEALILEARRVP